MDGICHVLECDAVALAAHVVKERVVAPAKVVAGAFLGGEALPAVWQ